MRAQMSKHLKRPNNVVDNQSNDTVLYIFSVLMHPLAYNSYLISYDSKPKK